MSFPIPTLATLKTRIFTDINSALSIVASPLRRAVTRVIAVACAAAAYLMHQHIGGYVFRECMPDTAIDNLARWAAIWKTTRNPATPATGAVTFTGTDGTDIPAGTLITRSDGAQFATDTDVSIANGSVAVSVTASLAGENGNTDGGITFTVVNPISGVDSTVTADVNGLSGGADVESDASLQARFLDKIKNPPMAGSLNDYKEWALSISGVTRAWITEQVGAVFILFVRDNDANIIPNADEIATVQAYINTMRPAGLTDVVVGAPETQTINFSMSISPNTDDVKSAAIAELKDMLTRDGDPGATLYKSRIDAAISSATGEEYHEMTSPAADIVLPAGTIPIFGAVTWL
jgi:uncharacterized phage protein gp47/JayE